MNPHKRHSLISHPKHLETLWRKRVHEAELKYTEASAAAVKVQAEYETQQLSASDGHYALEHALRVETETRQEYMRVLYILTRLLVAGEIPEEEIR